MATGNKAWISGHLFPSSGYIIWLTIPLQRGKDSGWGGAVEAFWPVHCGLTARVKDEMTLQLNRESSYIVGTWNFKLFFFFPFCPFCCLYEALWQVKRILPHSPSAIVALSLLLFYPSNFVSFFPATRKSTQERNSNETEACDRVLRAIKMWSPFLSRFLE